jgi:hypothetical protein
MFIFPNSVSPGTVHTAKTIRIFIACADRLSSSCCIYKLELEGTSKESGNVRYRNSQMKRSRYRHMVHVASVVKTELRNPFRNDTPYPMPSSKGYHDESTDRRVRPPKPNPDIRHSRLPTKHK